ncbi:amino acid transporter [Thioflavicoccus mobilis 8321]|uniref:Amino acid transporter n=1 Tax=Thioflavicoccus mobilis 8321 TaxID=765912 RepID=L0GZH1_9GAMM|nr:APC family permease [Thioflavicoccus mobilis]AGA92153.1 amino acid transporter [Thioflavicoccus mobilis 8321]
MGQKMGLNATWSMAVGGMVGGGIFSVLGVVVQVAAQWAWLSFVLAGLIALASAHSYAQLAKRFDTSGGAFTYLRKLDHPGFAASLAWVLILGYVLTVSVYAFTFGHYLAHAMSFGAWFPRLCAVAVIAALTWVNLRGVGESSLVEIVTVWGKLAVLLGLAVFGLLQWAPDQLTAGVEAKDASYALAGAAAVFMAYEGFQLLTYDYQDIRDAPRLLPLASLTAVLAVIGVYVVVALGATMLVGASTIVEKKEVALSIAGQQALGLTGMILVTIAAAFSTASAINATLFSTARLMRDVADEHDLPPLLSHENQRDVPDYAVIGIGAVGALLASLGSLEVLVQAASLTFLFTFGTVNAIAFRQKVAHRWVSLLGLAGAAAAGVVSIWRMLTGDPWVLAALAAMVLLATVGRPPILRLTQHHSRHRGD